MAEELICPDYGLWPLGGCTMARRLAEAGRKVLERWIEDVAKVG